MEKSEKSNVQISKKAVNRWGDRRIDGEATHISQDLHATHGSNKTKNKKKIKNSGSTMGFLDVLN